MEKTYTTSELIAFSKEFTLMRERANDICRLIEDEDAIQGKLNEIDYIADSEKWLKVCDGCLSLQKRIKLKIHAFVRRHYDLDSLCSKQYMGLDYVDMIFKFRELIRLVYNTDFTLR
jgi:hypothetical protein